MNQLELHKKIEDFIGAGAKSADVGVCRGLLVNEDAKRFFFAQVDQTWLEWLWNNKFFEVLKNKADDPNKYSNQMPELEYLVKMTEVEPINVTKIIDNVKISDDSFNPEVVSRFLWIIGALPAEQIKKLTAKIRDERWIYLMRKFSRSGYEFSRVVKKLVDAKECGAIIELAQSMFAVKEKSDISEKEKSLISDNPFYMADLDASGIFEALAGIDDVHAESALKVTTEAMSAVVKLASSDGSGVFAYEDSFSLFDVDFFELEPRNKRNTSFREDVRNLAATIVGLIKKTIDIECDDSNKAKKIFEYIDKIPSCRSMWRLRLFVLSRCPKAFKEELKQAFFKLFDVDNYYEIEGGTEYKKALKIGFSELSDTDQREYVKKVFEYFSKKMEEDPEKHWYKITGWEILSSICKQLRGDEPQKCLDIFGKKCDEKFTPEPSMSGPKGGFVNHKSPVNLEEYTIEQIIENLIVEWTPEKFSEQFKGDDFLNPRGTEGLGDALKLNVEKRPEEYIKNITGFFDRDKIHPHYLYSILRAIEEMLRNKHPLTTEQITQILDLFEAVRKEGESTPFKKKDDKSWLVDWIGVHKMIADILLYILDDKDEEKRKDTQKFHKEQIENLISYLFTIKDSPSKDDEKSEYAEPYGTAINSVRGRAFEALVVFAGNEGETLSINVQNLFKKALADESLAVRFVIGRYLATFYFRGKEFIANLLPEIFPRNNPDKKDIYLATWEGYLSNTLYDKLFDLLKDYYSSAIALDPDYYTKRKYTKGLDESLAIHVALAFAHLGMDFDDPLFVQFWKKQNITRHKEFVSFIGRSCLTREDAGDEWFKKNKVEKEKLIKFWNWALENVNPEALSVFGYWVNPKKEVLPDDVVIDNLEKTIKKTDGDIDWDYGFLERLPSFAVKNKKATLEIIYSFLLNREGNLNQHRRVPFFALDDEIKESLKIIYEKGNTEIRQKVENLISTLIEKGSTMFWGLKEVIK